MEDKEEFWFSKISNPFCRALLSPIFIVFNHLVEWFIWLMFIIVASQIGTIFNIIQRCAFNDFDLGVSLAFDSNAGVFYTFAMVTIASLIGPLFRKFIKKEEPEYRKITMTYITVLIFALLLCSVFYAFSSNDADCYELKELQAANIVCDCKQLVFFILAIVFSWYSFGLSLVREHEECLFLSDEHLKRENKNKAKLAEKLSVQEQTAIKNKNGENVDL